MTNAGQCDRFRTYPESGSPVSVNIEFGGGAAYTPFYNHMWNTLSSHGLSAFLFLGDNVYIDNPEYPDMLGEIQLEWLFEQLKESDAHKVFQDQSSDTMNNVPSVF